MGTLRRTWTSAVCLATPALTCCSGPRQDKPAPTTGTTSRPAERAPEPARLTRRSCRPCSTRSSAGTPTSPDAEVVARGLTAAIVSDQWSWAGAAGTDATGTALTPVTSLGIASVTKTFVAAEVLLLGRAGKIALDAPLAQYVRHKLTANNATVRHWTPEQAVSYLSTPVGPPGTYDYSNPSYVLLGMLIENVTGQPLATVLRREPGRGQRRCHR
jgi:CubicO group peptidase (beta-lactamase class C family)